MKTACGRLVGLTATVVAALVTAAPAGAETFTLESKRLEGPRSKPEDYPDSLSGPGCRGARLLWKGAEIGDALLAMTAEEQRAKRRRFSQIVDREPEKYNARRPLRALVKLGEGYYGFVLDTEDVESRQYTRLYFDLNHNGDLTDDGVIKGKEVEGPSYNWDWRCQFPRVDLEIDVDGEKADYGFFLSLSAKLKDDVASGADLPGVDGSVEDLPRESSNELEQFASVSAFLQAAVYREGRIEVDGKAHRVVLVDLNSNGRFDDERSCGDEGDFAWGDVLLVDPQPDELHDWQLTKLTKLDGAFYLVDVAPGGDRITLTPPPAKSGHVVPPADGFSATVYGDMGVVEVSGDTSHPIELPAGEWKLSSYTIDLSRQWAEAVNERHRQSDEAVTYWNDGFPLTMFEADGGGKVFQVIEGEKVRLPFGPPFRSVIAATDRSDRRVVELELSLVGVGGERCIRLTVDGKPAEAWLAVRTAGSDLVNDDELDRQGLFRYMWHPPWHPADEYHVRVGELETGPFEVDLSGRCVIRFSDLGTEGLVGQLRQEVAALRTEIERLREQEGARPPRTSDRTRRRR